MKVFNRALKLCGEPQKVGTPAITVIEYDNDANVMRAKGDTVPSDGDAGYAVGCIFVDTGSGAATTFYMNEGSAASADFNVITGTANGVKVAYTLKSSAYTATATDEVIACDATSAAFTITLPTSVGISGTRYTVKKIDASVNAVTIDGNGTETIDGAATVALSAQYSHRTIVSNGANWLVVATG